MVFAPFPEFVVWEKQELHSKKKKERERKRERERERESSNDLTTKKHGTIFVNNGKTDF